MDDVELIYESYKLIKEANLISKDPLIQELESFLNEKGVQKSEIRQWFLKTYINWFQSPADDNQKTSFISPYQTKDTDPEWAKKKGIYQFNQFTPEYKNSLSHLIDFFNTKLVEEKSYKPDDASEEAKAYREQKIKSDLFFKSLFKVTVPQMFEKVHKWDQEMKLAADKAENAKLQSVEGLDYEVVGVYDGYPLWKLLSQKAFKEEGDLMGHCVGGARYFEEYKKDNLFIYSLRKPREHNHPSVTFELEKDPTDNNFKIVQIKGKGNKAPVERYWKACRDFIENSRLKVVGDGYNIGMVEWNKRFYFKDDQTFQKIYKDEIIPKQKRIISNIMNKIAYSTGAAMDIHLQGLFLEKLPNFTNVSVKIKNFYCYNNQLTTLEGSPKIVNGNFICYNNELSTLKGAPQRVTGTFHCYNNELSTLEGAPQYVGGSFSCKSSKLTTLKGSPKYVGYAFDCSDNQLTTLEGGPQKVNSDFDCSDNQLTTLKGAPSEVNVGFFHCNDNQLTTLEGSPRYVNDDFDCSNNQLTTLEGAPAYVGGKFNCINNLVEFTYESIADAMQKSKERNTPKIDSFKQVFEW